MTSACPGETGNASATANAAVFSSRMRSCGMVQNGQSSCFDSGIVHRDGLLAGAANLGPVFGLQLSPQSRLEPDIRQVPVIAQVLLALELLERHFQHDALHF